MESFEGVRFTTRFLDRAAPAAAVAADLVRWCRTFAENGFAGAGGGPAGNLSCRLARGFLVTPAGAILSTIDQEDLVHVVEVRLDSLTVLVNGSAEPTSEAFLHHLIYVGRPDAGAVFHGHSEELLRQGTALGIPTTEREEPYGTRALAERAAELARERDLFLLANHGFVAVGRTAEEAGRRALEARALVRSG